VEGLIKLEWNLKTDRNVREYVYSVYDKHGISGLQTLARLLHKSGICGCIKIVSYDGSMLEDWTKGYKRHSTDIFNEQLKEVLGRPNEREEIDKLME
jgi:hypothetical protein